MRHRHASTATSATISDAGVTTGLKEALADSERKYRALAESLPYQLFMKNTAGEYILASAAFCVAHADRVDCVVGKTSSDIYPAEIAAASQEADREVMARRRPLRYEIELPRPDGVVQHLDVTKFPVFDSADQLIGLAGIAVDITEQRRAEIARQESEGRLRALIENLPFSISMKRLDGRYIVVSPELARNVRREVGDILGKTIFDIVPKEAAERFASIEEKVLETRRPVTEEFDAKYDHGKLRPLEVTKFPVFDTNRNLVGVAGLTFNVSEQRRAEKARQESEHIRETLRIYENSPVGLCYLDTDFRFIHVNNRVAEFNGIPAEEHLGRTIGELIPDVAAGVEAQLQQVIDTGEPIIGGTVEAKTSARLGLKRHFQHSFYPVKSDDGRVIGVSCVIADVTDSRRLAEEQLAHAQKMQMIGQLAGGIAHDFNNLLAIIRGHLEILLGRTEPDPGTAKRLQAVLRAARRGTDLTERLLAIGQRQSLRAETVRVDGLLDDMVELLPSALGSDISVEVVYESDLWPICIDPGRLEDAVLNIALNARAAMPLGGRFKINATNLQIAAAEENNGVHPFPQRDRTPGTGRQDDPRRARQLQPSQDTQGHRVARPPPALGVPLHPDIRVLAERRRDLLLRLDPAAPPTGRLPLGHRSPGRHQPIPPSAQRQPKALRLDKVG